MRTFAPLILAVLAGPGLLAQTVGLGAQVTLAKPVMDLDGGPWWGGRGALGFGLNLPIHPWRDQCFTPRVDVLQLSAGKVNILADDNSTNLFVEQAKVQIRSAGLDYAYYFNSLEGGPYAGLGLAVAEARFGSASQVPNAGVGGPLSPWPSDQVKKAPQYALMAGWKFNPAFGLELRFTQSEFKGVATPGTIVKAPVFGLSLTAEF